eukprot:1560397-Amphidinium_carterae.1
MLDSNDNKRLPSRQTSIRSTQTFENSKAPTPPNRIKSQANSHGAIRPISLRELSTVLNAVRQDTYDHAQEAQTYENKVEHIPAIKKVAELLVAKLQTELQQKYH